jgi:hypothetical protein
MLAATVFFACGKTERKPAADTGAASAANAAPQTPSASVAPAAGASVATKAAEPGALPKPVDQMSGDELFAFAHTLNFGGGVERRRRCRGNPDCRGRSARRSTSLRIDAVEKQDSLSAGDVAGNGVIAARMLNHGDIADTMYNTQPGRKYEYYLIVSPGAAQGIANWRLEQLITTDGARTHQSISTGVFRGCGHAFVRGARADFKTCDQAAQTKPASLSRFQGEIEPPIWVGCAFGCCTASSPDGSG